MELPGQKHTAEEREALQFKEDFDNLLKLPAFRRLLWHVIDRVSNAHGLVVADVDADTSDTRDAMTRALATYQAAGKQSVGIWLRNYAMATSAKLYQQMLSEAVNLRIERAAMSNPPK